MMVLIKKNKGCLKIRIENPISGGGGGEEENYNQKLRERTQGRKEGVNEVRKKVGGAGTTGDGQIDR